MKQANHVFEKVTKYGIRKLSVGVGPVAIGTFLLAGGFFVSKPVSADQVTKDATVHMAYVAENELTAEEQQQGSDYRPATPCFARQEPLLAQGDFAQRPQSRPSQ